MVNDTDNTTPAQPEQVKPDLEAVKDSTLDAGEKIMTGSEDENEKDRNWKAFREIRKKERAERELAEQRAADKEREVIALKRAMEAAFAGGINTQSQQTQNDRNAYSGEYREESEDERIEKKVQAAIAQREIAAEKQRIERAQQEYPARLRQANPDFDQVVSQENLDYLDYHYPEVSRPLQRLGDSYDKWDDVYRAVKKFVPNNTSSKKEAAKANANFMKPRSMSSAGLSQNTQAPAGSSLSEEKKQDNWARMQRHMKGLS